MMMYFLLATSGGAIGAGLRYLVNVAAHRWLGSGFPWGTLCVNVVGCLLMGLLAGLVVGREQETAALRVFLATGILGGFTTFSAFSLDFAHLLDRGATMAAVGYVLGSVVVSILALYAGLALAKAIHP
jgi:CrcB protein